MTNERDLAVFGRNMARRHWEREVQLGRYADAEVRDSSMLAALVLDAEATRDHLASIREWQAALIRELAAIRRLLEKPKRKPRRARKLPSKWTVRMGKPVYAAKRARGKK